MTSTASGNPGGQSSAQQSSAQTASTQVGAQQGQAPSQPPQPPAPQQHGASGAQQVGAQQIRNHISKTHCDSTRVAEIALLNKGGKRLENALIRTRNEMKAMTRLRRATEPIYAQQCPDPSDDESVITTSSSGTAAGQLLAKSLDLFRAASPKALTALASVVHKVSDAFKTTTTAPTLSDNEIRDSLRFASIPEVSVEPGMVLAPSIPVPYYELAKANFYMPLTMFTDDNLRWAHANMAKLKNMKNNNYKPGEKGLLYVNVEHERFAGEDRMEYILWIQAVPNFLRFALESRTDDIYHCWMDSHFSWVMTQANKGQLGWDIILDFDIHMRNRYRTEHVQFSGLLWDSELKSIVQSRILSHPSMQSSSASGSQKNSGSRSSVSSFLPSLGWNRSRKDDRPDRNDNRSASPRAERSSSRFFQPFRAGRTVDLTQSVCLICARVGHDVKSCSSRKFPDGSPVISAFIGKCFVFVSSNKLICIDYNVSGKGDECRRHRQGALHECSFCGSSDHHALKFSCKKDPRQRS